MLLIMTSVVLVLAELSLTHGTPEANALERINDVFTGVFIVELMIRFFVEPRKSRFFRKYWLDILAVIPFFHSLRILRVFRLLRL